MHVVGERSQDGNGDDARAPRKDGGVTNDVVEGPLQATLFFCLAMHLLPLPRGRTT